MANDDTEMEEYPRYSPPKLYSEGEEPEETRNDEVGDLEPYERSRASDEPATAAGIDQTLLEPLSATELEEVNELLRTTGDTPVTLTLSDEETVKDPDPATVIEQPPAEGDLRAAFAPEEEE